MIGFLRGVLLEKKVSHVILDVHGVGYVIEMPASSLCQIPREQEETCLYIMTYVREDCIRLFGFAKRVDRAVFETLISVSGVGPKVALALLGPYEGEELLHIITQGQTSQLLATPGVGGKTAERIILELKEKLKKLYMGEPASEASNRLFKTDPSENHIPSWLEDLSSALSHLGYKDKQITPVVKFYALKLENGESIPLEVALKESMKKLSEHAIKTQVIKPFP